MLKSIVGVVVGYIVMFIFASAVFAAAYFGLVSIASLNRIVTLSPRCGS